MGSMIHTQVDYTYALQKDGYHLEVKSIESNAAPGSSIAKLNEKLKEYLKGSDDTSEFAPERHLEAFTQMTQESGSFVPLIHTRSVGTKSGDLITDRWTLQFTF